MAVDTFASLNLKIAKLSKEMSNDALMHTIGKMAKAEARKAASADLGGDPKFSGWRPELTTRYDIIGDGKLSFYPGTKRAAGPWTVAERGRNQGNASGFSGPGVNRKTGITSFTKAGNVRKTRAFKSKRWNGVTQGKNTATDAVNAIESKVPKLVDQHVGRAIRRTF